MMIHVNFRSERHAEFAARWLEREEWRMNPRMRSTVSAGIPNGPYSGPVYTKDCKAGTHVELFGSGTWEGTYFVFVELMDKEPLQVRWERGEAVQWSPSPSVQLENVQAV